MNVLQRTSNSLREKGIGRTLQSVASVLEDLYFEQRNGLNTSIEMIDRFNIKHQSTRVRHFRLLMKRLAPPADSVFVDLGCGKGRVLLLASKYRFKRIVGVEISDYLCEIARKNIDAVQKKTTRMAPVEVVESNVLHYAIPDDGNVFYFFKPFDLPTMESVVENILTSLERNPRRVWLIYNNFHYGEIFATRQSFRRAFDFAYGGTEFVVFDANPVETTADDPAQLKSEDDRI